MRQPTIKILCVDDHSLLVDGLATRFKLEKDLEFVGSIPSADKLVDEARRLGPDVVLLDIEMPGIDPFEALEDLQRVCPSVRTVILSAYVRDHYISAATKAGAWGYFSKSDDPNAIVEGIRRVARGDFAFGPKVQERCQPAKGRRQGAIVPPSSKLDTLTSREQEVLRLIGKGLSRAEIAKALCRSPKTVDGHREAIMEKLNIHDRADLVRYAIREGLVEV
jgi:DNA-binding NarL/FixJ family response regulator